MNCADVPIAHGFYVDVYELFCSKSNFESLALQVSHLKLANLCHRWTYNLIHCWPFFISHFFHVEQCSCVLYAVYVQY